MHGYDRLLSVHFSCDGNVFNYYLELHKQKSYSEQQIFK